MSQRITIGKAADIPDGGSVVVNVSVGGKKKDIAVFKIGGQLFAIDDMCPHAGASLSGGHVEDGCVTCPWHYWRFRLSDGAWADNPRQKIGSYPVHVAGGEVQLEVPD
ncbi:MAG: Rieske 2Fe-2S domain-containing protein [Gemmataceae bacterium]|nr:Rieske 2Fe-2S domain-containing protein [Gemmataceae bacterium]